MTREILKQKCDYYFFLIDTKMWEQKGQEFCVRYIFYKTLSQRTLETLVIT